jgi:hypothetical protein
MTHMHWNSRRALRFLRRALLAIANGRRHHTGAV